MHDLTQWASSLEDLGPNQILERVAADLGNQAAVSSSFQTQSVPLLHMISRIQPRLPVLFLDTGYHFAETLEFRDRLVRDLDLDLIVVRAQPDPVGVSTPRLPLFEQDPDLCCRRNKVEPMRRAMKSYRVWISGIRADQTSVRAGARRVEQGVDGLLRVHPLLAWTAKDIWRYIAQHDLPVHPLFEKGYESVGCAPCTRPTLAPGERTGRWIGTGRLECGLHTELRPDFRTRSAEA